MGLFGKKRHGTVRDTGGDGRHFTWVIPHFLKTAPGEILDSDIVKSSFGVEFHFHIALSVDRNVGFYIHYKRAPIPKYSYVFASTAGAELRQQTAHYIPPDAEKCGHWSVGNAADIAEILAPSESDTLLVHFSFDDDGMGMERVQEDLVATWTIPRFLQKRATPFTGPIIDTRVGGLIPRIDTKRSGGYQLFLFARIPDIPPHGIVLLDHQGEPIARVEEREQTGAIVLNVPAEMLHRAVVGDGKLRIAFVVFKQSNPIEQVFLDNPKGERGYYHVGGE